MPTWGSLYFQNGSSPVMEQLIFFHDYTMVIMLMVLLMVGYLLINSCLGGGYNRWMFEGQELESVWTIVPMGVLLLIAFPSLRLLYLMEEMEMPELTIKVLGHQWFWSYEYSDLLEGGFDSYMVKEEESLFRLLEVDNGLVLPLETSIRVIVSSMDVIHSWALPALGVKVDAIPGRLNQISLLFDRVGLFVGQCSEICGVNHSFMPISVFVVPRTGFLSSIS